MKKIFNTKKISLQKGLVTTSLGSGFTLIELLLVIMIVAILASAVLIASNPSKKVNQAKDARVKSDMNQIASALQIYLTQNQKYPVDIAALEASPDIKKKMPKQADGPSYSYQTDGDQQAVLWGKLYDDVSVNNVWCWDGTNGTYKKTTAPGPSNYTCP